MTNNYFIALKGLKSRGSDEQGRVNLYYRQMKIFSIKRYVDVYILKKQVEDLEALKEDYEEVDLFDLLESPIKEICAKVTLHELDIVRYLQKFEWIYSNNNLNLIAFLKDCEGWDCITCVEDDVDIDANRVIHRDIVYRSSSVESY